MFNIVKIRLPHLNAKKFRLVELKGERQQEKYYLF